MMQGYLGWVEMDVQEALLSRARVRCSLCGDRRRSTVVMPPEFDIDGRVCPQCDRELRQEAAAKARKAREAAAELEDDESLTAFHESQQEAEVGKAVKAPLSPYWARKHRVARYMRDDRIAWANLLEFKARNIHLLDREAVA